MEKEFGDSQKVARPLFHNIADPIFVFDQDTHRFLDCNRAALDRYGYTLEELQTMTPVDLHPRDERRQVRANIDDIEDTSPHCYTHVTKDGERLQVEIHTGEIEYEGRGAWISIIRDITDRRQAEEALARERDMLQILLDNTADYIFLKDRASRFVKTNAVHAQLLGLSDPQEAVGRTDFDFFPREDAQRFYDEEQGIMQFGQPVLGREWQVPASGGEMLWVSESKIPFTDETGQVAGLVGIGRDVTARHRAEEALRETVEQLERHTASLERRTAQLEAASEVARDAAAILDIGQLLKETVQLVSDEFGFYHAGVFLIDEPRKYAILRAASSEGGQHMLERGHRLRIGEVGIVGHVAATGEPRIALDVGADAVFFDNPDLPETRSEIALPLKVRRRTIGILDVQSTQEAAFTEEDTAVLQTLADQLAIAIENARLVQRTEDQLRELQLLYGELSATAWAELPSPGHPLSYVYDRVDVVPSEEIPTSSLDQALERGQPGAGAEPEATETMLVTPLKLRDQIIGALGVQESEEAREWSPDEVALVEAVSEQVALALENARLFTETQQAAQRTQALYETSRALSSSLDEEALIHSILEAVYRTLDCEHVLLSTVDEEAETIGARHGIWRGQFDVFPEWIELSRYPLDHPDILTDIYRTGRTEIVGEWDERFNREIYDRFGHDRLLRIFMPIRMRRRVIGVIEVAYEKSEKGHVDEEEIQMLAAFADQAAVALDNARLFRETQRRAEQEQTINELMAQVRGTMTMDTVARRITTQLGQALGARRVILRFSPQQELIDEDRG